MKHIGKLILLSIICVCHSFYTYAQVSSYTITPVKMVNIQKEVIPPYLSVIEETIAFSDANGNKLINANEECSIRFKIKNSGRGDAYGCIVRIEAEGDVTGLSYTNQQLPTIKAGASHDIEVPISSSMNTNTGNVTFSILVDEPNGFGTDPIQLNVGTRKFDAPFVEIVSYKIISEGDTQLRKKKPFTLQVLLQNTDQGIAHNIKCNLTIPDNFFLLEGERFQSINILQPNETKLLEFEFQTNAKVDDISNIEFKLSESYGKYAKDASIPLRFGQVISSGMTNIQIKGEDKKRIDITKGSLISDVDEHIPVTTSKNPNMFVLIIANEHYQQVAAVPYALNDGNIFKEYCIKTLGVSEKHVHYIPDATINHIKAQVNWLSNITETWDDPQVIVYYAGHGIPDEASKSAYLLPVDGSGTDVTTGYKLDELYATLGNMPASRITVFMDACFSGSKREDGMLASARGVALKAKSGVPQGKMVVFSAAQGDETAYPNREQQHGLFTYYLLKKLQETEGNVALKELGDYVTKQVTQQSLLLNSKKQTPCVTPSAEVGTEWENWKLK